MVDNASFQILNISDILPNRFQPRIKFEDETLDELAESISRFGVIEPIVVRPIGNKYEIIAGERRFKASKLASKTTIPSIVIKLSDKDSEELALLENVQRQSLNPIEEAVSYKRILDMGYITRDELSKKIGKPQSVILNKIRLLNLADEVQSYLLNNKISERHARALLNIANLDDQVEMLHRIVNERLTVKKTNREIRNYIEKNKEDDTETLFGDERGNDKVDIDKLMREAQDINTDTNANNEVPDLMANSTLSSNDNNAQSVNNNDVIVQEQNKFVSVQPMDNLSPSGNAMAVDNVNNAVSFDNMFNGPINVPNVSNEVNTSVNQPPILNTTPDTVPVLDGQISATPNTNGSINEEISSIVSDALKNQPISNQSVSQNGNSFTNSPLNDIPDFSINSSTNNDINQATIVNNEVNNVSQNLADVSQNNFVHPVQNIPNNNSILSEQDNISSTVGVSPASDGLMTNSPTPQVNIPVSDNPQANDLNVIPDFAKIVEKLRACADEIEKSGHFINLEEVDLGNQYKVIFTFDK